MSPNEPPRHKPLRPDPPHRDLANPVGDPDPTEYPDPYEQREDPRGPADTAAVPTADPPPDPAAGAEPSTSEPRPPRNREAMLDRKPE